MLISQRRKRWAAVCLLLLLTSIACCSETGSHRDGEALQPIDAGPPSLPAQELHYLVSWDGAGTLAGSDGARFDIQNDLGFRFAVDRGWLVNHTVEALACEPQKTAGLTNSVVASNGSIWRWAWQLIAIPEAWAGHGNLEVSAARLRASVVEDLRQHTEVTELGAVVIEHQRLCEVHFLLGRAEQDAKTLPKEVDMAGHTLHIQGRWRPKDGDKWSAFTWRGEIAWGDVLAMTKPRDTAWGGVEITVKRSLAKLFEGIDPSKASELNAARAVLQNVVSHATIETKLHLH